MAAKGLFRNFIRLDRKSTDASEAMLSPKKIFLVRPFKGLYHTLQNSLVKSMKKDTGQGKVQEQTTLNGRFQNVNRKDGLHSDRKDTWGQTLINHATFQNPIKFRVADEIFDTGQRHQSHDTKAKSAPKRARRWLAYIAGVFALTFTSVWVFMKWREHTLRNRGVSLVHVPHFALQFVVPFGKYKGIIISTSMLSSIERAQRFNVRDDDVFVVSFPRSGTTWTQELVYLIGNEADREKACAENLEARFPYLEDYVTTIDELNSASSPRYIKSHLPYRLLPAEVRTKKPKLIYVMRNPKDVVVSFHHLWLKLKGGYKGEFSDFCELFLNDKLMFTPWIDHVEEFWKRRHHDNILFIQYEDLYADLRHEVRRISEFMGKSLTDEQVESIVDHCSFESMKNNPKVNYNWWDDKGLTSNMGSSFIRKGRVGDWKNFFTPELNKRMDKKVDSELQKMGIEVKYEVD